VSIERRMVILVVEDDDEHYELIERSIRLLDRKPEGPGARHELHRAKDGAEALKFLTRKGEFSDSPRPSLILLDLHLPRVMGLDVLKQIKEDDRLRKIPVVVLTVSESEEDMVRAYDSGAAGFLQKPVMPEQFEKLLSTVIEYWRIAKLPE